MNWCAVKSYFPSNFCFFEFIKDRFASDIIVCANRSKFSGSQAELYYVTNNTINFRLLYVEIVVESAAKLIADT